MESKIGLNEAQRALENSNDLCRAVRELYDRNKSSSRIAQLADHFKILTEHCDKFQALTAQPENFPTINVIEEMMVDLRRSLNEVDLKALIAEMANLGAEPSIIIDKKKEYRQQGVILRNLSRYKTSIMSLIGRIPYERMALKPASPEDKARLAALGIKGYIFPLDEALGVNRLPFKVTIRAMLEIAKESTRCESYEEAQKNLQERTNIVINDDTMRKITNTIGKIVFDNDVKKSAEIWQKLSSRTLVLPESIKNNIFYLEIDGAMIPIREKDKTGSSYRENKLAEVFSTDNFTYWTDKHGKNQHNIDKREYLAFIGDYNEFKKLVFSLAIRNGYGLYNQNVLISDGSTWIRNLKNELFPDAQQILDYYHLTEHINDYAKEIFDCDESQYKPWGKKISSLFYESKTSFAIEHIKQSLKFRHRNKLDKLLQYIHNNDENIDYASYRAKNYFIGSGAIESSNWTVLQRRMKYGAMRWNIDSAQSIVTLVAKARSGLWEKDVVSAVLSHYGESQSSEQKSLKHSVF
ncbi:MAG: hypothetical protein LBR11_01950 [Deltaproteobacteria bacterium]|jgi:hypothetical protein|nr:hypothetical protein [Deltaproteobacteria bacterium]